MSDVWLSGENTLSEQSDQVAAVSAHGDAPVGTELPSNAHLRFSGVRVIRTDEEGATPGIPPGVDLELDIGDEESIILRAGTAAVWTAQWSELVRCSTPERVSLSGGGRGVLLVVETLQHSSLLAVLPADRPRNSESAIRASASQHGVRGRRSSPPALVVAGVVAIVAAAVTAVLLAAGHAIHL
ncbi:MAG: hypothetical protein ACLP62_07875 [Acidimicrobiales bacterium]